MGLVIQPVIYLAVWVAVASSQGGAVGGYTSGDLAAYFLVMMVVHHLTFTWNMFVFEYRVRTGEFSPLLLQPLHPLHRDVAENIAFKTITMVVLAPTTVALMLVFEPRMDLVPWRLAVFLPTLALAFVLRFFVEWSLALAAFWTTRVAALNQVYFFAMLFLAGRMAPLDLMPAWVQPNGLAVAVSLDAGVSGRTRARSAECRGDSTRAGGAGGLDSTRVRAAVAGLGTRHQTLLGGGIVNLLRLAALFFRIGLMNEMAYRTNFLVQLLQAAMTLATSLAGLAVIFAHTEDLGGWSPVELVALLGVYLLMGGLIGLVIQPSMQRFMEDVRSGTLDFTLTKPEDAQVLVCLSEMRTWRLADVGLGMLVLGIAMARRANAGQCLCCRVGHGHRDRIQFLGNPGHAHVLVCQNRKYPGYLSEHVRGRPLASRGVPPVAARCADLPDPDCLRSHCADRGSGRSAHLGKPGGGDRTGRDHADRISAYVEAGGQTLFRSLGVKLAHAPRCSRTWASIRLHPFSCVKTRRSVP